MVGNLCPLALLCALMEIRQAAYWPDVAPLFFLASISFTLQVVFRRVGRCLDFQVVSLLDM